MSALRLVDHRHKQNVDIDTFRYDFDQQLPRDGGDHEIVCDVIDKLSYALNHVIVNISWDILSLKCVAVVSNCNVILHVVFAFSRAEIYSNTSLCCSLI